MATDPQIEGFDADAVRAGLRTAMRVGMPPVAGDQPVFFIPQSQPTPSEAVDQDGVPFDPTFVPDRVPPRKVSGVTCAVEYSDGEGKIETFGVIVPSKVKLTFLDEDYQQVVGFEYVVISGRKYLYQRTETTKGLVSVGLYVVHCTAEDEG